MADVHYLEYFSGGVGAILIGRFIFDVETVEYGGNRLVIGFTQEKPRGMHHSGSTLSRTIFRRRCGHIDCSSHL